MANIAYKTDRIARYFSHNRISWQQFYESERVIIDRLKLGRDDKILDIGCGCGGLGLALQERFGTTRYTGVEINQSAAEAARELNPGAQILCGDILDLSRAELHDKVFDVVFSLSCVDWNIDFSAMLAAAWLHVRPGGHLVATFRLTDEQGCSDFDRSYQYINYEGIREGERANYVVVNADELIQQLAKCSPAAIDAYGYWGPPSATAITPYQRLCFAAVSVRKRSTDEIEALRLDLQLPAEILHSLKPQSE